MSDLGNKEIMAKNLKFYMDKYGKDRNDISNDLNIPYTTVTAWVTAETYPRIDKIEMLSNYFNISKSDLVEDKDRVVNPISQLEREGVRILFDSAKDLSDEALKEVLDYVEFVKSKYNK